MTDFPDDVGEPALEPRPDGNGSLALQTVKGGRDRAKSTKRIRGRGGSSYAFLDIDRFPTQNPFQPV